MTGSNLYGDCVTSMDRVEVINNNISWTGICRVSDSQFVGVDGSFSTMYRSITNTNSGIEGIYSHDTSFCRVTDSSVGYSDTSLLGNISYSLGLTSDH